MPLNSQEFQKRSEDFFVSTYLNSVGIIQSISLGVLAAKLYMSPLSPQFVAQTIASFLAIVIIASEYSWWVLLIRRTPGAFDYLIPYALGVAEFGVMAKADNNEGGWFLAAGLLAIMGILSLFHNRGYAKSELFAECPWVLPLVRRNLLSGIVLIALAAVVMLGAWFFYERLNESALALVFIALYAFQVCTLILTSLFMERVRKRFEAEYSPF